MTKNLEIQQQRENGNKKIYAPLKNKWLKEDPEELVRQNYICKLVNDYDYSLNQMKQELNLTKSRRGHGSARADIVIWDSHKSMQESKSPIIVVECKPENVNIKENDYYQGQNYAYFSGAKFIVLTNEKETKYFQVEHGIFPKGLGNEIIQIPKSSELNNNKKIEELLNATKTFERDEFAKLLLACHNIIRDNDKLDAAEAFDEISKILFIKIWQERKQDKGKIFSLESFKKGKAEYDQFASQTDRPFYHQIFKNLKSDYDVKKLFDENDVINLRENSIEAIIQKLEKYNLSDTSDDVKGIAFEKFLGTTFRGELGQFFTPRPIVDFIVEVLDPKEGEIICDPCCGSGGFLIKVFEYIRGNIEQEIKQQKETIKQKYFDEDFEKALEETKAKTTDKVDSFLSKLNQELDPTNTQSRIYNLKEKSIYGTDANPRMARTSKMNMIMHGDGHSGMHHNDGLLNVNGIFENRFDVILTNPPFGGKVNKNQKITEKDISNKEEIKNYTKRYGNQYKQGLKQITDNLNQSILELYETSKFSNRTEVLFMERCLKLLKPGGRLGMVLPEGVLNNAGIGMQKIRDYFERKAKILLIVSIPKDVFKKSGADVKTSIVFFKRFTCQEENRYQSILKEVSKEQEELFKPKYDSLTNQIKKQQEIIKKEKNKVQIKSAKEELKQMKKEAEKQKKQLNIEKTKAIKKEMKQKFNYQIPICEVEKAGVDSKGAKTDNHLLPLLKEFASYKKTNALWEEIKCQIQYKIENEDIQRISITGEPIIFHK